MISYTCDNVEFYYYDGQIPVETFEDFSTGDDKLTRNFVGARGIEMMETTVSGATTQAYPLYDTHGNMVATLSKNTAGTSWSLGNERSHDFWGSVRSGAATGGPKGRYVANLGHVADDESGLIYMRARYYEPESGRFVSVDAARSEANLYRYCANNPIGAVDSSGNSWKDAESAYRNKLMALALLWLYFTTATATSSLDVENAYGKCMDAFNFSLLESVGLPEGLVDAISLIDGIAGQLEIYGRIAISLVLSIRSGNPLGLMTSLLLNTASNPIVTDYLYIATTYSMRVQWYIDDIQ